MKRILALTYEPKVPGVIAGTIRQTIRPIRNHLKMWTVGDQVAFHGWSGAPYDSPWSFRTPYKDVTFAEPIMATDAGILWPSDVIWEWDSQFCEALAILDGITPGTGRQLKRVLEEYHGDLKLEDRPFQVIRW